MASGSPDYWMSSNRFVGSILEQLHADLYLDSVLLEKLDNLDGKADGKLDLNMIKTMDVFYDSGASKSRLELAIIELTTMVARLNTQITSLASLIINSAKNIYTEWGRATTTYSVVMVSTLTDWVEFEAHSENTANLIISLDDGTFPQVPPGERRMQAVRFHNIRIKSASGVQYYKFTNYYH